MSFIYRDFLTPSVFRWNRNNALYKRFYKAWPKRNIDGVVVYNDKLVYWDKWNGINRSEPFKRFLNIIGVEFETLAKANYKGIKYAYFVLNTTKYKFIPPTKEQIVNYLNMQFAVGDEFELRIHYGGESKRIVSTHWKSVDGNNSTIDTESIKTTLHSDPMKYFANAELGPAGISYGTDKSPSPTPVTIVDHCEENIYSPLALLDNGTTFQQIGDVYDEALNISNANTSKTIYTDYSYNIKYKVIKEPDTNSYIVKQISNLANKIKEASDYNPYAIHMPVFSDINTKLHATANIAIDTSLKKAIIKMAELDYANLSDLVYTYDSTQYLKVDAVARMKRKDFAMMLSKIIDTGYKKKKSNFFQKILAAILIVASIFLPFTYIAVSSLTALAEALAISTLALTVGLAIYARVFPYATDMIKLIGGIAQMIGLSAAIIGVITSIQTTWNKFAEKAVEKKIIQDVSQYNIGQFIKDFITNEFHEIVNNITNKINTIIDPSKWELSNLSDITLNNVSGWLNNIGDGFRLYMKFFGDSKQYNTINEKEQATKEDGVESVYLTYEMLYDNDALSKIDMITKNNLGGQKTENFLVQIY